MKSNASFAVALAEVLNGNGCMYRGSRGNYVIRPVIVDDELVCLLRFDARNKSYGYYTPVQSDLLAKDWLVTNAVEPILGVSSMADAISQLIEDGELMVSMKLDLASKGGDGCE